MKFTIQIFSALNDLVAEETATSKTGVISSYSKLFSKFDPSTHFACIFREGSEEPFIIWKKKLISAWDLNAIKHEHMLEKDVVWNHQWYKKAGKCKGSLARVASNLSPVAIKDDGNLPVNALYCPKCEPHGTGKIILSVRGKKYFGRCKNCKVKIEATISKKGKVSVKWKR